MKAWAQELKQNTLLKWNGLYKFQQKMSFSIESGSYVLKTASNFSEVMECFKLRHEVFFGENGNGIDFDKYDSQFDHLIIIHKESGKVIGTYRISCIDGADLSYTNGEFKINELLNLSGPHLELGRACIHRDHRRGSVLSLLWRGVCEYLNLSGAQVLFGCSSVMVVDSEKAALIYKYLCETGAVDETLKVLPRKKYQIEDFDIWLSFFKKGLSEAEKIEAQNLMPSLLKSYIKNGARIAGLPALDREFGCIDFLTVLKKEDMTSSLTRRFQVIQ